MKNLVKLTKNEMKMVVGGGVDEFVLSNAPACTCNTSDGCTGGQSCTNCGSNGEGGQKWGYCE